MESYSRERGDTGFIEKKGWLIYWHNQTIWVEANISAGITTHSFFANKMKYENGVSVKGNSNAALYKAIARCYSVKFLFKDSVSGKIDYSLSDRICIIPVRVKCKFEPVVSNLMETMGFDFKKKGKRVLLDYKFETNYSVIDVELLRKNDKRRIRQVKEYVTDPLQ